MRKFEQPHARHTAGNWPWLSALVVATFFFQGCLGSDDEGSRAASDPPPEPPVAASETNRGAPDELVHRCNWSTGRDAQESAIRDAFVDREPGEVRLLLADDKIRPGEILSVAVVNDSSETVRYGTFSHVETKDRGPG
jgi:hypothetical protein